MISGAITPGMVEITPTWEGFREGARVLLRDRIPPEMASWRETGAALNQLDFLGNAGKRAHCDPIGRAEPANHHVPRHFMELGEAVACHRDPLPWPLLYRTLWRLVHGERELLSDPADPDMASLNAMERAVRRDCHKMKAFVRFRSVDNHEGERFIAWFEPKHRIVRRTAPFFVRRFPSMRWSILTPDECAHWDGEGLSFSPGVVREMGRKEDPAEEAWLTYYASTFNPARIRVAAMRAEMPIYYWRNLPEAAAISPLLRAAPARLREMIEQSGATDRFAATPIPRRVPSKNRTPAVGPPIPSSIQRIPGIRIGVAGWDYPDWAGRVYPERRAGVDRLRWIGARLDLLEINSTFYRPASARVAASWLERTADQPHLLFTAKIPQLFTHREGQWRNTDVEAVRAGMLPMLEAGKLRSLLVQFPWSFRNRSAERKILARILDAFEDFPLHVEVRHASWDEEEFRSGLSERGVGFVNIDQPLFHASLEPSEHVTNRIGYLRLHGRNSDSWFREDATRDERYDYEYSPEELAPWVTRATKLAARDDVDEVEVVFNNHYRGQAVTNADMFRDMLLGGAETAHRVSLIA